MLVNRFIMILIIYYFSHSHRSIYYLDPTLLGIKVLSDHKLNSINSPKESQNFYSKKKKEAV